MQPGMTDTKRKVCDEDGCTRPALAEGRHGGDNNNTNSFDDNSSVASQQKGKRLCRQHSTGLLEEVSLVRTPCLM